MVVQFICRGNAFRSIIAEAYLNSLQIPDLTVLSSGTVASKHKKDNSVNFPKTLALLNRHGIQQYAKNHYADDLKQELLDESDIAVFLNKIAFNEANERYKVPENTKVWDVTDIGEEGRIATSQMERENYSEEVFREIVENVDELVEEQGLGTK